jgi:hypothetical protein
MDLRGTLFGLGSGVDASANDYIDLTARRVGVAFGEIAATREPLQLIAEQTGGRAIFNSSSIDEALQQAVRETADYYLLAWRPDSAELRDSRARLKVSIKGHPEWRVRLRANSFSIPAAQKKQPEQAAQAREPQAATKESGVETKETSAENKGAKVTEAQANENELLAALASLYPQRGLPVALSVGYLNTSEQSSVLKISMQLARTVFDFETAGSKRQALVDVAGVAIDDRGQFGSFKQLLTVPPDPADADASQPIIWHQQLSLKPGLYQVRVALRDRATGRVGSSMQWIEIPDLSKGSFALSSIFLGERSSAQTAPAEQEASKPRAVIVDVDHRFARASILRFQTYVYNAARAGGAGSVGGQEVQVQAQVFRGTTPLITTSPAKAPVAADPARLPFWSELSLEQLPPGRYVLQVTATDRTINRSAVERISFYVE